MSKTDAQKKLRIFFRRHKVVDIKDLFKAVQSNSRMTVFRRLSGMKYISSYTHAGKYYTLNDIPRFDTDGLWFYDNIGFSQNDSLKNTIQYLVNNCDAGKFHFELEKQLRVRVHNVLLDLVKTEQINRTRYEGKYLYISINPEKSRSQIEQRKSPTIFTPGMSPSISYPIIIEALVEIINQSDKHPDAEKTAIALNKKGLSLTTNDIIAVFDHYGIEKKIPDLH